MKKSLFRSFHVRIVRAAAAGLLAFGAMGALAQATLTLSFVSQTGDPIGKGHSFTASSPTWGVLSGIQVNSTGRVIIVMRDNPVTNEYDLLLLPPGPATGQVLAVGSYNNTVDTSTALGTSAPGMDFSGDGTACTPVGRFDILEITTGPSDGINFYTITSLAVNFEQHCTAGGPGLFGQLRYNSSVAIDPTYGGGSGGGGGGSGQACFLVDSDHDGIPDCLELPLGTNPGVKDNNVFASAQLFVMQQYRDFLQRESEFVGATYWIQQISGGTTTRTGMVKTFMASPEFGGTVAPVARLYFAYFARLPDVAGLRYWSGQVQNGTSLEAVSDSFATSPEFAATYGSLDNSQFVDLVYNNILGRPADTTGHGYWQGQLDTATMTRGQVMLAFSESAEFHALIDNDVYVTMLYLSMLQRAPDSAGFTYWTGYLDAGNPPDALIDLFLGSAEYRARFLP